MLLNKETKTFIANPLIDLFRIIILINLDQFFQ